MNILNVNILHIKNNIIPKEITFENMSLDKLLQTLETVEKSSHSITNVQDIFEYVCSYFGSHAEIHIEEYSFDHKSMYHVVLAKGFPKDIIFIKRDIIINDDYELHPAFDKYYTFRDIVLEDLAKTIRERYVHKGLIIGENNVIKDIEYIIKYVTEDIGTFQYVLDHDNSLSDINSIKFINTLSLKKNVNEKISSMIQSDPEIQSLYTCYNIGIGILKCFINIGGHTINDIMSNMLSNKTMGDVFIGLENNAKYTRYNINLTQDMLQKINKSPIRINNEYNAKNKNFCNVYYELENI
jgi:hypothetical protein